MIDEKRIVMMLENYERNYKELMLIMPNTVDAYKKSVEKRRACERVLQLLIEQCIDISNIIIKEMKFGLPSEEEMIFDILAEKEVISEDLADKLKEMKKFRNLLVHLYSKIDDQLVFENLKEHYDFLEFKKEIKEFLKEQKKKNA